MFSILSKLAGLSLKGWEATAYTGTKISVFQSRQKN